MSDSLDHEDPIEEVASTWLAERADGFSTAQKREFERWCRADGRHAAAIARLEAACAWLEKIPLVRKELQPVIKFPVAARAMRVAGRPERKVPLWRVASAFAAVLALAAFGWWQWSHPERSALLYTTSVGGYERVVLLDGSVVELNANSKVRVVLLPNERRVTLVQGEAHFSVAHDGSRPFIVSTSGVAVRAVGTAFNVRLASTAVEVLVTEGKVTVSDAGASRSEGAGKAGRLTIGNPLLLTANERTILVFTPAKIASSAPPAPVVERITPEALRAVLSWQERKFVFSETPLREVVAQFNRRNRLQIVLDDAAVAERPVGGTFAADNVDGFVRLLESSGTIVVERRDEATVVLRGAR